MKVAFLIEQLEPRRGGMETSASEFLAEVVALGVNIQVITQSAPPDFSVAPIQRLGTGGLGRAGRYHRFVQDAQSLLSRGDWPVVHAVTPCLACDLYQPRSGTAREAVARTVAARRSPLTRWLRQIGATWNRKQRLFSRLEHQLLTGGQPPLVAALSQYMRRQLVEAYALNDGRVRDVFNGVAIRLPEPAERAALRRRCREEAGLDDEALVSIFVGHNFRRKGLARLLEALTKPEAARWHLLVLGKDSPGRHERYVEQAGLAGRVRFLGARPDVRQWYLAADVCVLPTYYDPCSRTVLEALSLGVPCITTAYDGSSECIQNGEQGFVLDSPEAVDGMARALNQLREKPVRQSMSQKALALRPYLSMRRHAKEVVGLYEEIFRSRGAPKPARASATIGKTS